MYQSYIASVSLIPLLTNEDDRRQQKEPATTLIQVRTERESTACFGQTRAVDAQFQPLSLGDSKLKQFTRSTSSSKQNRLDLASGYECVHLETSETQKSLEDEVQ
ncbi:Hypothetical_protein [Hexamita inflata]|uniref:Hypothetical_protein n=1 Tax=Hexamita inflata TaxID=28002 RepID=A0AA86P1T3_9EUKA|nr:Hypothetical protein HINF_LOCUS16795 [Hexamita inflata]